MKTKLKIFYLRAPKLKKLDGNPRKLKDPAATEKLRKLIRLHGFQNPLQVWRDPLLKADPNGPSHVIICGNHRFDAGRLEPLYDFPCIEYFGTKEEATARAISDNRSSDWTEWDTEKLEDIFTGLPDDVFDSTGFNFTELQTGFGFFADEKDPDPADATPVVNTTVPPVAGAGDLWLLGNHRLLCGDATSADDVFKLMFGEKADMVFTDPPYNANYRSRGNDTQLKKGIMNDDMSDNAFDAFIDGFTASILFATKPGSALYVCCNRKDSYPRFYQKLTASGVNVSSCIVWNKGSGGMGWQDYRYQYEFILYGFKLGEGHSWFGGRSETDIWECKREARQNYIHPTQKPVEIITRAIKNSSKPGSTVVDLFLGSGSTLIACEKTDRVCYGTELDPKYCDVILKRWAAYTGEDPVRWDGKTWSELNEGK